MSRLTVVKAVTFVREAKGRKRLREKALERETPAPQSLPAPREVQLLALAITWEHAVRTGKASSYAEIARQHGVSRAWVSRIATMLDADSISLTTALSISTVHPPDDSVP